MRWFWLFIVALVLLTAGLFVLRVNKQNAPKQTDPIQQARQAPIQASPDKSTRDESSQPVGEADSKPDALPATETKAIPAQREAKTEPAIQQEQVDLADTQSADAQLAEDAVVDAVVDEHDEELKEPEPAKEPKQEPKQEPQSHPAAEPEAQTPTDLLPEIQQRPTISAPQTEPIEVQEPEPEPKSKPKPSYDRLEDGSIRILDSGTIIKGDGSSEKPYLVDWLTLRSIERTYNPKQKKTTLPDWLDLLDGKRVKIIGNTLVPVIATATNELLVMQNPWDGCCVGIPPTPYDAIEVTLNHDVDFGSSAVGYGTVEGEFVLDPYVVDGWVLGLYMIDDATYRSGDGIAFPDF